MRIGFDGTPLLGRRTGIGRYVEAIAGRVSRFPDARFVATAFARAPASALQPHLAPSVATASKRVPARVLQAIWSHSELLPVSALCGQIDLFHGTNFVLPPVGSAKGVLTVHDLTYLRFPETVTAASARYADLVPRGIERADVVCTLTHTVADEVSREYGLDRSTIVVTSPGVEDTWFDAEPLTAAQRQALGVPARYLLAVGTVEPRKNLAFLVAAHRRLRAADAGVPPLVLAGPSGWGPDIGASPDDVLLIGYVDTPILQGLVAGAQVLVFPSRYEGFGLPPLEALAAGVPVVVTDLPVTREVLGPHAGYFAGDNTQALQEAIESGLQPAGVHAREDGRRHARGWTWDRCAEQVFGAYRKALSR